jgi:glycosyltransferase involved in cell wall biosynthesis
MIEPMTRRIALCQDWVMSWSGSDQVAGRMASALGVDDVYTFAGRPELLERLFAGRTVHTSPYDAWPKLRERWSWLLPLMARWWRSLDLSAYDAVITSSHSAVNSVRKRPDAVLVSYCHTPMRYAWTWRSELGRVPPPLRPAWPVAAALLRRQDEARARNVDLFLANSKNVAGRIERFYGRKSIVLYPPIDTSFFTPDQSVEREDFFLYVGRLAAYKRPDVAIRAASMAGVRLVVAGSGAELDGLKAIAGPTVEFRVQPSDEDVRDLYRRARALVFAGVEDFGMVMVEAQACGTPVVAYAEGGALEAVVDGDSGLLYRDPSDAALADAMRAFDPSDYPPEHCRSHAERFGIDRFERALRDIVMPVIDAGADERSRVIEDALRMFATPQ